MATRTQPANYQSQFGPLNFMHGEECSSVLSASAYLLSLMRLKDTYVDEKVDGKDVPELYTLKKRRPDLWDLALSCENTNTSVSYVEVINNILEERAGKPNVYTKLAEAKYPFNLPFNKPLVETQAYFKALNVDPIELYKTFTREDKYDNTTIVKTYLNLSDEQYPNLTTAATSAAELAPYFGCDSNISSGDLLAKLTNSKNFGEITGLSYDELRELLRQNLSKAEQKTNKAKGFFINAGTNGYYLVSRNGKFQKTNDGENYTDLSSNDFGYFDRINRLARLAKHLNWSTTDLNWVLQSCCGNQLDDKALQTLAIIKKLQSQYKDLNINTICALAGQLKDFGQGKAFKVEDATAVSATFFDQVFNNPFQKQVDFSPLPNNQKLTELNQRLLGALKIDQEGLETIYKTGKFSSMPRFI